MLARNPDSAMFAIDYNHDRNLHTVSGARAALKALFEGQGPRSLLDVGCGRGTWIRAALDLGVSEVYGLDGVAIGHSDLLFECQHFRQQDLSDSWDLGRRFDVAICLEAAEHLSLSSAPILVGCLVKHSDTILFSAATPGQIGQHHVNCQWPVYWQSLFNGYGFSCDDWPRWKIWNCDEIEPWYRQNLFMAKREPSVAGTEARIRSVVHPDMLRIKAFDAFREERLNCMSQIEAGHKSAFWYLSVLPKAAICKLLRSFSCFASRALR
jgi:hypothetical protein